MFPTLGQRTSSNFPNNTGSKQGCGVGPPFGWLGPEPGIWVPVPQP